MQSNLPGGDLSRDYCVVAKYINRQNGEHGGGVTRLGRVYMQSYLPGVPGGDLSRDYCMVANYIKYFY